MKTADQIQLTHEQRQGLAELHNALLGTFEAVSITLFGSVARGESEPESDLDLLIVTAHPLPRSVRHQITDIIFDINLRYGTNFSALVVDRTSWDTGPYSVLPLHDEIEKEAVLV